MYREDGDISASNGAAFLSSLTLFADRLRSYLLLLLAIVITALVLLFLFYSYKTPTYTAEALIGPPTPSPTAAMYSSMGQSLGGGLTSKLLGGDGGGGTFFNMYRQLLVSSRLVDELARKDMFLERVFNAQWDAANKRWASPGPLHGVSSFVKRLLNRPVSDHPGVVELQNYLMAHLSIKASKSPGASGVGALTTADNAYIIVSFTANNPAQAASMLQVILDRADEIIRQEQLQDVNARIAYIENWLPRITQAEQKTALIQILANQEQIKMMTVADKRFSYVLISTPYASTVPTTPMPIGMAIFRLLLLCVLLWGGMVAMEPRVAFLRWMQVFMRRRARG